MPHRAILPGDWYDHPRYYDLAMRGETRAEADFVLAAAERFGGRGPRAALEPGCGSGRLVVELAARGLQVWGFDRSLASLEYCRQRLSRRGLTAQVFAADLSSFSQPRPVDVAYCFCNTFRHLLSESAAAAHLRCVARALSAGGIYILGLHLLPPDASLESSERWSERRGKTRVTCSLRVASASRRTRVETLRIVLRIETPSGTRWIRGVERMRLYTAVQLRKLLAAVGELEIAGVFDFWYDIDYPQALDDDAGDVVLVLRKRKRKGRG